ncbi:MAG: radical SAM protein, partial [Coriobacteriia bacterium]|nr:radical SAM protein [Coriobacteriia bacterium]
MATPHTARAQDPQTRPHRPSTWCLTQGEKGEADANNRQTRPQRSGPVRGEEGEACEYTCLHTTRALCPECLRVLDAEVRADADQVVWLWRRCPEHGVQQTRIWPDAAHYQKFCSLAFQPVPPASAAIRPTTQPCPTGCGICQRHRRRPTLVEIELTQRCNLHCPVCFMSAEADNTDLPLAQLDGFLAAIIAANGTDTALQLTGGEPTVRADLPEVVRRVRAAGFWGVEVNTNGLVISRDLAYLEGLVAAGLTGIYLQFDGLTSEVYTNIRGTDLLATKLQAVQNCRQAGIQVVLAMTVVAGLNDDQLGQVINYALDNSDTVVGVALQPAFTSGRFEAKSSAGLTMGDIIFALADQTHGLIGVDDILPLGCSHPLCDAGTYLVESADRA